MNSHLPDCPVLQGVYIVSNLAKIREMHSRKINKREEKLYKSYEYLISANLQNI